MSSPTRSLLLVEIKQEETITNRGIGSKRRKPQRRRQQLYGQQDLRGSNGSDCASIGDAWHPSPASSPSSAEVNHGRLTPTFSSSVPTGDLNAATCLSIPPKVSAPTSPLESNTSAPCEYTCEFCGKAFAKIRQVNAHVYHVHKKLGRFSCEICSKTLGDRAKLKDHIDNVHKKVRKWTCEFCAKCFSQKASLKTHIDGVHNRIYKHTCEICGTSFQRQSAMVKHIDCVHKNLRNFPCDICGFSFKHGDTLKMHVNAVHKKLRAFLCEICGRAFTQSGSLKTHLKRLHPENPS